ncbi:MAG: glycosyltransferase family 4 protein [Planctomycetota bacterium]
MRILYVSQYYPPDMGAPSARVSELARHWQASGHEVTVLTAVSHHPHGKKRPEDRRVAWRRERDGDVDLVRTYVFAARNAGFFWRIVSFLSFMLAAMVAGMFLRRRYDVVIATSPQLFTGIAGWWLARFHRAKFIFEVRDLWPESIVGVGAMQESAVIAGLERLARWLYVTADLVVTVGSGYRRRIIEKYGIPANKIRVVTNGVDLSKFNFRNSDREKVRRMHGWEAEFVVLYLGTEGMAHGLEFVLDAAEKSRDAAGLRFVFVGDGAERPALQLEAERRGLTNVTFLPAQLREKVVGYYAAADVCLVPLRRVELFADVVPSKMFEIMAMERPIIVSVDGFARDQVIRANAGIAIEPENADSLANAIDKLRTNPGWTNELGRNGRPFVARHFCRKMLADSYLRILAPLVTPSSAEVVTLPLPEPAAARKAAA